MAGLLLKKYRNRLLAVCAVVAFSEIGIAGPTVAAPSVPSFEAVPCGFKDVPEKWSVVNGVTCGWVTVKAHHERADSALLRLWIVRMSARDRKSVV